MRKIVLDTSSIVFALSKNKDIFAMVEERFSLKPVVSDGIVAELRKLGSRRTKEGAAARLAMQVMENHKIEVLESRQKVDNFLFGAGKDGSMDVCTNDTELKQRLKRLRIRAWSVSSSGILR